MWKKRLSSELFYFVSIFRDNCIKLLTKGENCIKSLQRSKVGGGVGYWGLCVSFLVPLCLNLVYADIGAEWNPTGNPIGGGPGYSDSICHQDADFLVKNKTELLSALSNASSGDIIYVADSAKIDLSGEENVNIYPGITLASGRGRTLGDTISWGALIYTNELHDDVDGLFRSYGSGSARRITGLRFRGPYAEPRDGNDSFPNMGNDSRAHCIQVYKPNVEIDNCEFWGWTYGAANIRSGGLDCYFHHNWVHHSYHANEGYGLTSGVTYANDSSSIIIEANLFDYCKHMIAGSGDSSNSYEARYNILESHGKSHSIDRHGTPHSGGPAGRITNIHDNTFTNTADIPGGVPGIHIRGTPTKWCHINNNWFFQTDSASAIKLYTNENCSVYDNHFGLTPPPGVSDMMPVAVVNASTDSGGAPLTVTFKATGSYDPDGDIRAYYWNFGDGYDARYTDINDSVVHTFDNYGIYKVELMVTDDVGCIDKDWVEINVSPPQNIYYLSVWVKERFHYAETGYYFKQIFIDDHLIWEQDCAGDEGWVHVVEDVTDYTPQGGNVRIKLRICCRKDRPGSNYSEFLAFWDDVALFCNDTEILNGDFESTNDWAYSDNGSYWCDDSYLSGDVRSGERSYWIRYPAYADNYAGTWAQIEQTVNIIGINDSLSNDSDKVYDLYFPFPNPSMTGSKIGYQLPAQSDVTMKIHDISGRLVKTLIDETKGAGYYSINWDGRDERGFKVPNGVYFYRFKADPVGNGKSFTATRKLVVLKK